MVGFHTLTLVTLLLNPSIPNSGASKVPVAQHQ